MDHEPSDQGATDTEGTPSVAEIPLPAQKEPPRTRASTADSSGVEVLERDESPGVLSNFSISPGPGLSLETTAFFQQLVTLRTIQPGVTPQITRETIASIYPHAGQALLNQVWDDFQKFSLNFYAKRP